MARFTSAGGLAENIREGIAANGNVVLDDPIAPAEYIIADGQPMVTFSFRWNGRQFRVAVLDEDRLPPI